MSGKLIRILTLTTSYPTRSGSISGIFVQKLVDALRISCQITVLTPADDQGHSCISSELVCYRYAPKKLQVLAHKPGGIPSAIRSNKFYILLLPFFLLSYVFHTYIYARRCDLVLANWAVSGVVGGIVGLLLGKPLVTVLRGEDVAAGLNGMNAILLKITLRLSDRIVSVSDDMDTLLRYQYPSYSYKFQVIKNGVDADFFAVAKLRKHFDKSGLHLLTVGSLIKRKNITFILNDLATLAAAGVNFRYAIVGDGPMKLELEEMVRELKISDKVFFLGQLIGPDLLAAYRDADFFVSASLHEGRPNAVAEAVAAGAIPLLSNINGHREFATTLSERLIFNTQQAGSLCELLLSLKQDNSLREELFARVLTGAGALITSWDAAAQQYNVMFKERLGIVNEKGVT